MALAGVLTLVAAAPAGAQATSAGTLTVTATVEGSISLTFEDDIAGVALTGAGTNAATLNFGTVSAYAPILTAGVTRVLGPTAFTVSSPFGVQVVKANSASAGYTLAADLASLDATNTWTVNATVLTTSPQNLGTGYAYGGAVSHTVFLTVPFAAAAGGINQVLNFTATAN